MHKVLILGGHGDGLVAAQVLRDMARAGTRIELAGYLNDRVPKGEAICGVPVLGKTADWKDYAYDCSFHVALHKVGQMRQRCELIEGFGIPEDKLVALVHPNIQLADDVRIGAGCLITSFVTCQPGVRIGRYATVRSGANLGHDVELGDFAYVGPNASLSGCCRIGQGAHVSPGAVVSDGMALEPFSVLGAGAVALRNLDADSVWLGNPARKVR